MKIAKFSFLLIFIFSSLGFAVLPPEELPDSVANHPNPLLTDIEPLCVVVASHNSEKNKFNPLLKNIKNKVEAELKKSGVEVISLPDENSPPELAELRIMIDILHPQNSGRCFMSGRIPIREWDCVDQRQRRRESIPANPPHCHRCHQSYQDTGPLANSLRLIPYTANQNSPRYYSPRP